MIVSATVSDAQTMPYPAIPAAYQGTWALDQRYCEETGPAVVRIDALTLDRFDHRHEVMRLSALNDATDIPIFHGRFDYVDGLRFGAETLRLEIVDGKLALTEGDDPDAPAAPAVWLRCAAHR